MKVYKVSADPITGEWLNNPVPCGELSKESWYALQDNARTHYDTFEFNNETCGIEVNWFGEY